jgi:hypothetical protein
MLTDHDATESIKSIAIGLRNVYRDATVLFFAFANTCSTVEAVDQAPPFDQTTRSRWIRLRFCLRASTASQELLQEHTRIFTVVERMASRATSLRSTLAAPYRGMSLDKRRIG